MSPEEWTKLLEARNEYLNSVGGFFPDRVLQRNKGEEFRLGQGERPGEL
jgi:hypothetical protein